MPRIEREVEVVWEGSSARGSGTVAASSSGSFDGIVYSEPSRVQDDPQGQTSPEELLAAAHAQCFSMSLATELTRAKAPPERLRVVATTVMDEVPGVGHRVVGSIVHVRARAAVAREAFDEAVRAADEGCPFSQLIKASGTVSIEAELEEGDD